MAQALATFAHPSHSLAAFLQFELFRVYNNNKAATAAAYFYSEVSMKRIALFSVSFLVLRPMPIILLLTVPALFIRNEKK
ncbi:hypothetical protein IUJ34_28185 (plasmid) [Klebsiella pneumoniae subsp. pneumoniae]|uniref:Uncharacterized protein n=1 Tax=Klebsiella pneumoniae subsp. pneumoniae TaxID=72407 RepID=A0A7S9E1Z8_KLEPN|nr:hypothetical protein IUJ34_28185 [Klebsiella pneumoniae subsp. pneumoniae]